MNILVISDRKEDYRIHSLIKNVLEVVPDTNIYLFSPENWKWIDTQLVKFSGSLTEISFDIAFRHGSDLYYPLESIIHFKICFSGAGAEEHKGQLLPDEFLITREIPPEFDFLGPADLNQLFVHLFHGGERPDFIFNKHLENSLQQAYHAQTAESLLRQIKVHIPAWSDFKHILWILWDGNFSRPQSDPSEARVELVKSKEDWERRRTDGRSDLGKYDLILVQATLVEKEGAYYAPKRFQTYYGLEILREIRMDFIAAPIILVALDGEERIRSKDRLGLLYSPGHYLLSLSAPKSIKPIRPLTSYQLEDINYYLLNPVGRYHEIWHNVILPQTRQPELQAAEFIHFLFNFLKNNFYHYYIHKMEILEEKKTALLTKYKERPAELLLTELEAIKYSIKHILDLSENRLQENRFQPPEKTGQWQLIIIDDDADYSRELADQLEKFNIESCIYTSAEAALAVLKEDVISNSITVVVVDWRLKEPDQKHWQPCQGLDVIHTLAYHYRNLFSLIMLTDKRGAIINSAQKSFPLKLQWYFKEDLKQNNVFHNLVGYILEEGNRMEQSCLNTGSTRWNKSYNNINKFPLRDYFRDYIMQPGYRVTRYKIETFSEAYVGLAALALGLYPDRNETPLIFTRYLPKNGISPRFRQALPSDRSQEDANAFYSRLAARRIYLGLMNFLKRDRVRIGQILFRDKNEVNNNTYLNNYLAIPSKAENNVFDFFVPEEIEWLDQFKARLSSQRKAFEMEIIRYLRLFRQQGATDLPDDPQKEFAGSVNLVLEGITDLYDALYDFLTLLKKSGYDLEDTKNAELEIVSYLKSDLNHYIFLYQKYPEILLILNFD